VVLDVTPQHHQKKMPCSFYLVMLAVERFPLPMAARKLEIQEKMI